MSPLAARPCSTTVRIVGPEGLQPALEFPALVFAGPPASSPGAGTLTGTPAATGTGRAPMRGTVHGAGRPRLRRLSKILLALAALQMLDLASTLFLLAAGGTEANPLSAWLLRQGTFAFVAVKAGLALALGAIVLHLERHRLAARAKGIAWTALGVDAVYVAAVASNLLQVLIFA